MADEHPAAVPAPTPPEDERAGLLARYEELRAAALARKPGAVPGGEHGLALLGARGMAAWMAAWRSLRPPPAPVLAPGVLPVVVAGRHDVVSVLATMAAACVGG